MEMLNGQGSRTKCMYGNTYQKGSDQMEGMIPKIISGDNIVCNGIVHMVDNIIVPDLSH
jgi:hypothetical protein